MTTFDGLEEDLDHDLKANPIYIKRFIHNYWLFGANCVMNENCSPLLFAESITDFETFELCFLRDKLVLVVVAPLRMMASSAHGALVYMAAKF